MVRRSDLASLGPWIKTASRLEMEPGPSKAVLERIRDAW